MILNFWISFCKKLLEVWNRPYVIEHSWNGLLLRVPVAIAQIVVGILIYIPLKIEQFIRAKKDNKTFCEIVANDCCNVTFELMECDYYLHTKL